MTTGTVLLPITGAMLDASVPPGIGFSNSIPKLLFDDTTPESCYWQFRMPQDYASSPVLKVQYSMASATSNKVEFEASVMAVSDGDPQDMDAESYDSANTISVTVPGTAGYLDEISLSLTNADSLAAGDYVRLKLSRDADDGTNDTATGDCEVWAVSLEYTTS
jgi:hypothetical protein